MKLQKDDYHLLICDPKNQSILTRKENVLPLPVNVSLCFIDDPDHLSKVVQREIGSQFGLVFLRVECETLYDRWYRNTLLIFEVHCTGVPQIPEGYVWVSQSNADKILVDPPTAPVVQYLKEFKELGLDVNGLRLFPYSRPGWFDEANNWMKAILTEAGHPIKYVNYVRTGTESAILRATAESGSKFYMKALPPRAYNDEVTVSCALAEVMPDTFTKPLVADKERRWMIMSDYGPILDEAECLMTANPDLVRKVLCDWARIQKKSIPMVGKLEELGVPVLDRKGIRKRVEEMVNDGEWMQAQRDGMNEEEKRKYDNDEYKKEFLAYVDRLCRRLSEYKVPLTLVHGDVNAVNVVADEKNNFTYIDFAYTVISFPFLDALSFMTNCVCEKKDLDFYLELWTEYESMERLRELLDIVEDLETVETKYMAYHFYEKAEEGTRSKAHSELWEVPICSEFSNYL